ncbi:MULTISPECIES: MTAP family purine nucleoside phosphorylase [unclassified Rathayibacter]|uniref:MTAP family purine nucleoside phosphorylase n=1 Tax=unclassified Rathayibacter TaxID=2609250 RepID=UPI000F4BAD15|nr:MULTISPECIES: MTAP family purine nucleoside phosphorylase [unclassified Rathayibacter]ROP49092.1 methylthioadenosine phosphorylase [Rathayibacter sp. PhB186]ROS50791.1 methylthioadenosine phosphorylase [Rathayibacter sp. PhB185]
MTYPLALITSRLSDRLIADARSRTVPTPFGEAIVVTGEVAGVPTVALERYGPQLSIPSHKINYRANIWALRSLGARSVISQNAIGSLNRMLRPGDIVISDDLLDRTQGRKSSFFDELDAWVRVDMTTPFCHRIRSPLIDATAALTERYFPVGTFACFQGPRLETPAEVRALAREGGDIVGTPVATETILAKEAGLCFASIAPIINWGSGLAPEVNHAAMNDFYYSSGLHERVEDAIAGAAGMIDHQADCSCHASLDSAYFGERPDWLDDWRMPESAA